MNRLFAKIGALFVAIVSFGLTVGFIVGLQALIGFNLFSLMWWFVIPIGAFSTGLLAASGYYLGAVKLNVKPTPMVAAAMLLIAALVQITLYYSQYAMAVTEDGLPMSQFVSFPRFVGWMLSHAKYGLIVYGYRPGGADGGLEVGLLGYVVAAVQFLALIAGGFSVYAILADKPYCDACAKFVKQVAQLQLPFGGDMNVVDALRKSEALSSAYFESLQRLPAGSNAALELIHSRCPGCSREVVVERPMLSTNGKLVYKGEAYRTSWARPGVSLVTEFKRLQIAKAPTSSPAVV